MESGFFQYHHPTVNRQYQNYNWCDMISYVSYCSEPDDQGLHPTYQLASYKSHKAMTSQDQKHYILPVWQNSVLSHKNDGDLQVFTIYTFMNLWSLMIPASWHFWESKFLLLINIPQKIHSNVACQFENVTQLSCYIYTKWSLKLDLTCIWLCPAIWPSNTSGN